MNSTGVVILSSISNAFSWKRNVLRKIKIVYPGKKDFLYLFVADTLQMFNPND